MTLDRWINLLVTLTLVEMMATLGLGVTLAEVLAVAANGRLLLRAALANFVAVPLAVVGLLFLFGAEPMVAAGFLIAAVCPGAPYGPPFTAMVKGNVVMAVGLMVMLAGSSAIFAPLLLRWLLPLLAGDEPLRINLAKMVFTLLICQLLPLGLGLFVRQRRPGMADALLKPAKLVSTVLNVLMMGLLLATHLQSFLVIRLRGFVGMTAILVAALAAGWLLGLPGDGNRRTLALTTAVRNMGVSLVIVTGNFPDTPAVTATLVFGLFQTVVLAVLALGWGRRVVARFD